MVALVLMWRMLRSVAVPGYAGALVLALITFAVAAQKVTIAWSGPVAAGVGIGFAAVLVLRGKALRIMERSIATRSQSAQGRRIINQSRLLRLIADKRAKAGIHRRRN